MSDRTELLLGIDIGTSACKAAVFDLHGAVLAQASEAYAVHYPRPGWAQQHPDDWYAAVCATLQRLAGTVDLHRIAAVGVDGQSWSAVAVDREGHVLCPTPIWLDTRAQDICQSLRQCPGEEALFACGGNPLQPGYTLPKILWYKKHLPQVYRQAHHILQSNSFIACRLTGVMTQDLSQGYGYACFDMKNGAWNTDLAREAGLDSRLLPPLYPSHAVIGHITQLSAAQTGLLCGTPVVAGGLDAACGTLGAGVISPGQTQEQGGQAGGMSICLDHFAADPHLILSRHVVPGCFLLQGGTTGGGGALRWLRETVCPDLSFEQMSALASSVPAGSEGVTFLPYMAGERSPLWDPAAKGVFFGLSYGKGRAHLIRAVMEGVAYSLRHNLETAASAGAAAQVLRAMGGSANSPVWTQIKADVTGCTMEVPFSDHATTLGSAILAGVGVGAYADFSAAVQQTVSLRAVYTPQDTAQESYAKGYRVYLSLYHRLKDLMHDSIT